jgi:hypothetical protein
MTDDDSVAIDHRALMELVAKAFEEGDPVPDSVVSRGRSYVRWMAPDADIGVIVEEAMATSVRDVDAGGNDYVFETAQVRIELTISPSSIAGSVQPWRGGSAWLEHDSGPIEVDVTEDGEFYLASPPSGPMRLRLQTDVGQVITDWFFVTRGQSS